VAASAAPAAVVARPAPELVAPSAPSAPIDLLVVEDDPLTARIFLTILDDAGYQVLPARDGAEALRCVTSRPPVVVRLDLHLPDTDGWTVLEHPHAAGCTVPVVLTTVDWPSPTRLLDAGVAGYLPKPFDVDQLLALVERLVGSCPPAPGR
jgi:DNA-binding response OmpR family regulator